MPPRNPSRHRAGHGPARGKHGHPAVHDTIPPQPPRRHVAQTVEIIFEDTEREMTKSIERLSEIVSRHYDDPAHRQAPESNGRWTAETLELTERFVNHVNANFAKGRPASADAAFYVTTVTPCVINHALRTLQGEVLTRPPCDATGNAYRQALLETSQVMVKMPAEGSPGNDFMRRHLNAAIRDSEEIVAFSDGRRRPDSERQSSEISWTRQPTITGRNRSIITTE